MTAILASLGMLIVGAALCVLLARTPRLALAIAMLSIVSASVLCLIAAMPCLMGTHDAASMTLAWPMPLGQARLAMDGLSAWFLAVIAVVGIPVAIYAWAYLQAEIGREPVPALGAMMCVLIAALVVVVVAADAAFFLVGWELMMLGSFFLVSFHHRQAEVRRAAWIYLIANHVGTALFVIPLFGVLVAKAGTIDFDAFRAAMQGGDRGTCVAVFLLGLLGFGTKAGFMPMHIWLPVAHPAAPTPVSALLSGVVIKMGIYGLLRLLGWLPSLPPMCAIVMLVFGMTSGVLGVLYALAQHDIKRLLAYHSVENIGIIGLGIGVGMLGESLHQPALIALGYGGALLHVLNHALFKGLLFLSAGAVIHATGTGDMERLGGLVRKTPLNAALFLVAAISICGLPPFNGFVSEWMLYGSLFGAAMSASPAPGGVAALGALALSLMGGLALACFAKAFGVVFLGEQRDASIRVHATPALMLLGMFMLSALCIGIGALPGLFVPLTAGGVNVVAVTGLPDVAGSLQILLASAGRLSLLVAVLLGIATAIVFLRRAALRRIAPAPSAIATWGCGFAAPSARMQYTASSFAWSLIQSFRHLLWPERRTVAPVGAFAGPAELASHTPDMAEHDFFAPLLRGIDRLFRMFRSLSWTGTPLPERRNEAEIRSSPQRVLITSVVAALRRGSIHAYLAFIVVTLLAVFFVEALESPGATGFSPSPAAGVIHGGSK